MPSASSSIGLRAAAASSSGGAGGVGGRSPQRSNYVPSSLLSASHQQGGGIVSAPPTHEKSLGEFMELGSNYEGSYKPARMGLLRALESGKMRNPLSMQQSATLWSARATRPPTGEQVVGGRRGALGDRPRSAGGTGRLRDGDKTAPLAAGSSIQEKGVGVLMPQRIELPSFLNTPVRKPDGEPLRPEEKTQAIRKIQDLELLVFACRRASKLREEGRAHFSLAVLRDNLGQHQKAIECYNEFLRVCKECNDSQGSALAYHSIAVDYQLLGGGIAPRDLAGAGGGREQQEGSARQGAARGARGGAGAAALSTSAPGAPVGAESPRPPQVVKPELLRKAIHFHTRHRENSDAVGKFVAHLNMGLAYALLGEKEAATVNHQYALRYAMQLHSLEGQSLAIGSLSFSAGMYENDPAKMRALVERYVELCGALKQSKNQVSALKKLGIIAGESGNSDESINYFQQAIERARAQGDRAAEKDCAVRLGVAAGTAKMADHLSGILQQSVLRVAASGAGDPATSDEGP